MPGVLGQRRAREMLVTYAPENSQGRARTAIEVVKEIKSQPGGITIIIGARKLPSRAFALIFQSVEAK